MKLESIERIPEATILHHLDSAGNLWATRGRMILKGTMENGWERVARFPRAYPRDLLAFIRPMARAFRADKANIFVNGQGRVLGIRAGSVFTHDPTRGLLPLFQIQGDSVLHGGLCEDQEGWSYFGEYFMNPARGEVRIFRLDPTLTRWEIAHTFAAGEIRHVHGVYRDPYDEQALWVTSGDASNECYLFRTRNRFGSLERFGDGAQRWRAVRLFFTEDAVCWITDSQVEQNFSCRWDRRSGELSLGQPIGAPAWYGSTTREGLHVAFTTVEPGAGVMRSSAGVFVSRDAFQWQEIFHFHKDIWRPMKLFKYGVVSCPSGQMSNGAFFISGEGLRGLDGISARLSLGNDVS